MIIPNPWPWHSLTKLVCRTAKGDVPVVAATRGAFELDFEATAVLLSPVKYVDRGVTEAVGPGKVWTPEWGMLDPADYQKKVDLREEEKAMEKRRKRQRKEEKKEEKEVAVKDEMTVEAEANFEIEKAPTDG